MPEQRLVAVSARRLSCVLPEGATGSQALLNSEFVQRRDVPGSTRSSTQAPKDVDAATTLGGWVPPANPWSRVQGMAVEEAPMNGDVRHLLWLKAQLGEDFLGGVVLTTGTEAYCRPYGIAVVALGLVGP